jgi:carboxyl-terminal processing protease
LLTSLDEEDEETDEETESDLDAEAEEQDPKDDVLLMEAGNVLADALIIKRQRFAAHSPEES